ncbi:MULTISPECIES: hypothetical protein [unclassified Actinomyces]|uniref:hypothetical protein n=1 Tax=unclassified Actinomyces TaxID=2609248 RepID=UPI000D5A0AF6|nr:MULTISPECIES: hypothetical protein [unclassified Actinomyces]RAX20998.1 hypothetical protein DRB07_12315 [Actinomyces sp. Z3]
MNDTYVPSLEIGVLGRREGAAAAAATAADDAAYGALIGEAAIRGLALRLSSERVVHDHSLATYIAERLPAHGDAVMRPVTITVAGQEGTHAATGFEGAFSTTDDLLALVADAAGWELNHEVVGSPDVSAGRECMSMRVPYWSHTMAAFLCALALATDDAGVLTSVHAQIGDGPTA